MKYHLQWSHGNSYIIYASDLFFGTCPSTVNRFGTAFASRSTHTRARTMDVNILSDLRIFHNLCLFSSILYECLFVDIKRKNTTKIRISCKMPQRGKIYFRYVIQIVVVVVYLTTYHRHFSYLASRIKINRDNFSEIFLIAISWCIIIVPNYYHKFQWNQQFYNISIHRILNFTHKHNSTEYI